MYNMLRYFDQRFNMSGFPLQGPAETLAQSLDVCPQIFILAP